MKKKLFLASAVISIGVIAGCGVNDNDLMDPEGVNYDNNNLTPENVRYNDPGLNDFERYDTGDLFDGDRDIRNGVNDNMYNDFNNVDTPFNRDEEEPDLDEEPSEQIRQDRMQDDLRLDLDNRIDNKINNR